MDPFDQLDAALNAYDQRKITTKTTADQKKFAEDAFLVEFSNFRTITAHPVLEEIGNRLRERGHEFRVEMNDRDADNVVLKRIGITLHVYPEGNMGKYGRKIDHPQFSLFGEAQSQKVRTHVVIAYPGGGSQSGPGDECTLAELSTAILREKAIKCIMQSFSTGW